MQLLCRVWTLMSSLLRRGSPLATSATIVIGTYSFQFFVHHSYDYIAFAACADDAKMSSSLSMGMELSQLVH